MTKQLGPTALIDPTAEVTRSQCGAYTEVGARTKLLDVQMDDYSYVVNDSDLAYTQIGKFCSIASHVRINPGNHPTHRATQSHFTYRSSTYFPGTADEDSFFEWRRQQPVKIGHDVWIGHGAIILPGRRIGTGAVVGAGSVVTKDVPDYQIVVGNPARILRPRLDATVASRMMTLAWWDWSHAKLEEELPAFRSLSAEDFVARHGC